MSSIAIVLNIPTAIIISIAAVLYGSLGAIVLGTLSFSLAIILMYVIAKVLDQGITARIVKKYMPRTNRYISETDLHAIIYLRLIFFALPPINWMLAILCTRFSTYFWGSLIGAFPNVIAFSWLGGTLVEVIREGRSIWFWNTPELITPTVVGISLTLLSIFLRKRQAANQSNKSNES
ncbi:MAG: VTT domain-containing protein [Pseudomonadales bacterium]|nr:VTT domain-containing protein [Pseudomonadales bacterium]